MSPSRNFTVTVLVTFVISVIGTILVSDYLQDEPKFAEGVTVSKLFSKTLNEEREVIVHLPASYERNLEQRYPVIYVLDGSSQDVHTAHSAALMARIGVMPEVIVVGLPNTSGANRERDYTPPFMRIDIEKADSSVGGGEAFLAFLKNEVIPLIEKTYRTTPYRMLAGHSRGGLFVAYSLLADSNLFHARFAHSPALWREDALMVSKLTDFLTSAPNLHTFFYMSMGDKENDKMMAAYKNAIAAIKIHSPAGLHWYADITVGADHYSNPELATPVGFKNLYLDWQSPAGVQRETEHSSL
jgi:predicted alpha/beta superfamily hydrolase